jgi:hypothetical protein
MRARCLVAVILVVWIASRTPKPVAIMLTLRPLAKSISTMRAADGSAARAAQFHAGATLSQPDRLSRRRTAAMISGALGGV